MKLWGLLVLALGVMAIGCNDDPPEEGNEADHLGVGAICAVDDDCLQPEEGDTETLPQQCLTDFTGGYCGIEDCMGNMDCPDGAACVAHTDNVNYCFRQCANKEECNINRPADQESNCSSNITFVDVDTPGKACVPPSG